jgi:NAD(P)-dependent dehydrogenase (short-subunit alcohol dehydrogenase family)
VQLPEPSDVREPGCFWAVALWRASRRLRESVAGGGEAEASQVDARDGDAVEAYTSNAIERAEHIGIVFNAIGLQAIQGTPLLDLDSDDFIALIVTWTTSQFLTSRAAARHMGSRTWPLRIMFRGLSRAD